MITCPVTPPVVEAIKPHAACLGYQHRGRLFWPTNRDSASAVRRMSAANSTPADHRRAAWRVVLRISATPAVIKGVGWTEVVRYMCVSAKSRRYMHSIDTVDIIHWHGTTVVPGENTRHTSSRRSVGRSTSRRSVATCALWVVWEWAWRAPPCSCHRSPV